MLIPLTRQSSNLHKCASAMSAVKFYIYIYIYIYIYVPSWHYIILYHHSHHRDNVTAPHGRPNLRSKLHCCHAQERGPQSPQVHVVALDQKIYIYIYVYQKE